eukprot:CAMPEP_0172419412 /NCGR_PEP_ID=MMETSP1064-20121228/5840_1 /TAXON_ID=202472 /ORGANISM="Aulacoseira subarctica , Strain CCAP 1002/5" /LENGTH=213 /DNA_ID=CAMNT_0013158871 /DNA_START=320 /DNA_END=960 /DNA_ORIENTATION=+
MKSSAVKIILAILMVTMPFAVVVGFQTIEEDRVLAPDLIGEVESGEERIQLEDKAFWQRSLSSMSMMIGGSHGDAKKNIVEIAVGASPEFATLVAALKAAGLVDALSGEGPFTVFAPTNAAAALPAGTLDSLLLPENIGTLQNILKYHVVSGKDPVSHLRGGKNTLTTLNGKTVTVEKKLNGDVFLNGIKVNLSPMEATNGVIYAINDVLTPP